MRVLITGGSSDIALAIAKRRIALGDDVVITCSSEQSLKNTLIKYQEQELQVEGIVYSFEEPHLDEAATQLIDEKGIDAIILNAFSRMPAYKKIHELPIELINQYISQNIQGNIWLVHHLLPSMITKQFGRIVFISSLSAQTGTSLYGIYCTAKAAIEGFILNLAVDYGTENILANIVRAGLFKTNRTKIFWQRVNYQEKIAALIPQGKMGEPTQLAESLDPLLSVSSYITGSIMTVSGGLPMIGPKGLS